MHNLHLRFYEYTCNSQISFSYMCFILYIFLSVFNFRCYRWEDLLKLLEIKFVIIIYCEFFVYFTTYLFLQTNVFFTISANYIIAFWS